MKPKVGSAAAVFGDEDEDDDEEEMPPEAKMRMKNIGRLVTFSMLVFYFFLCLS